MAKLLFIEARKKFDEDEIDFSKLDTLKAKTISIAATVQYLNLVPIIKKYLESRNFKVIIKKGAFYDAHVVGCNPSAFDKNADILLLLADGKFHAINNALIINKEIYVFNTREIEKVTFQEIEKIKIKKQALIKKFLLKDNIGLIVSTKIGQNFKQIEKIKIKIERLDKKVFIFEADSINLSELENFPEIESWINTGCYGLAMDNNILLNLSDVLEFLN